MGREVFGGGAGAGGGGGGRRLEQSGEDAGEDGSAEGTWRWVWGLAICVGWGRGGGVVANRIRLLLGLGLWRGRRWRGGHWSDVPLSVTCFKSVQRSLTAGVREGDVCTSSLFSGIRGKEMFCRGHRLCGIRGRTATQAV